MRRRHQVSAAAFVLLVCLVVFNSISGADQPRIRNPQVVSAAEEICPILVGDDLPNLVLKTVDGEPFDLKAAVATQATVLIYYRGGW
jgi:hypothetical protein